MAYTITITKTEIVTKMVGKEWTVIGQEVQVTEDVTRDVASLQPRNLYGYTPLIEKDVEVTTEILRQTVDELDLIKVIRAINNIPNCPPSEKP